MCVGEGICVRVKRGRRWGVYVCVCMCCVKVNLCFILVKIGQGGPRVLIHAYLMCFGVGVWV